LPVIDQDYTTLTSFRLTRGVDPTDTSEDALYKVFIRMASNWFAEKCDRNFVPVVATRLYDRFGAHIRERTLDLDDDLLELTTLTNGNGTVIGSSDYLLRPSNVTPKYRIELLPSSGKAWAYTDDWQEAISVRGIWGYHEQYDRAWKSRTTLAEDINDSVTSIEVASATGLEVLDYLLVGDEQMQVTAISANTLTVLRGVNGTSAAAHTNGAAVSQYQQTPAVKLAVERLTGFFFDHRKTVGTQIEVAGQTSFVDGIIPNDIWGAVQRYARPTLFVV